MTVQGLPGISRQPRLTPLADTLSARSSLAVEACVVMSESLRPRRFRFRLFSLFLGLTLLGVILGYVARAHRQSVAVAALEESGCTVVYNWQTDSRGVAYLVYKLRSSRHLPLSVKNRLDFLDYDYFGGIDSVWLHEDHIAAALIHLKRVPKLPEVFLVEEYDYDSDTSIPVNPIVIQRLQKELPNVEIQISESRMVIPRMR